LHLIIWFIQSDHTQALQKSEKKQYYQINSRLMQIDWNLQEFYHVIAASLQSDVIHNQDVNSWNQLIWKKIYAYNKINHCRDQHEICFIMHMNL
jgi:uncharacterized protein (DUF1015 family)